MPGKRPKNLLLDAEALEYGVMYADYAGTTLSRLVEDYLKNLPRVATDPYELKSPLVAEMWGMAQVSEEDAKQQREFLMRWRKRKGKE